MNHCFGIFAHVDAGKTTFSEQILYHAHVLRAPGRVDHQDTFLDAHQLEKKRGITIFSDQAHFSMDGQEYELIDTPGHVDFSAEMERVIQVLDFAVVVVSAVEGVQGHTETVFRLLKSARVPVIFFINKMDRMGADFERTCQGIRQRLGCALLDMNRLMEKGWETPIQEQVAENDERLLEAYLEGAAGSDQMEHGLRNQFAQAKLMPVFRGSALNGQGIEEFLSGLKRLLTEEGQDTAQQPFAARVYKIRHDAAGARIVHIRVMAGEIHTRDEVEGQKVSEIRRYSGSRYQSVGRAVAGELCALVGISGVKPGDGLGALRKKNKPETLPLLRSKLILEDGVSPASALGYCRILEDEDPLLAVEWSEELQQIHLSVMGVIQLEVLKELFFERFGLKVSFGPCEVVYKETIAGPVIGYGHYEPLRHYAEVHLRLEPGPRGSGIQYESLVSPDDLEVQHQRLIGVHVMEKQHKGMLTGSALTDVKVRLIAGRVHLKHTEGGDLREAVYRAIRQGLEQVQMILLEPWYRFEFTVPESALGRLMGDLAKMGASFESPRPQGTDMAVEGRAPVAEMMDYAQTLMSYTHGKGGLRLEFCGYAPCHNAQEVIEKKGYHPELDLENTSASVFCAKGAGFVVHWSKVKDFIHIK